MSKHVPSCLLAKLFARCLFPFFFFFTSQQQLIAGKVDKYHLRTSPSKKKTRTGCPECYGKLNCGCPDCYVPEYKRGKKKRVTLELESVDIIPQLEYSACTAVARVEGEGTLVAKVTKAVVRTQVDFLQMFIMSWSLS